MATGSVGEPAGLGATTGMGMTVMDMGGGARDGGTGSGRRSSALGTLLMWSVEL